MGAAANPSVAEGETPMPKRSDTIRQPMPTVSISRTSTDISAIGREGGIRRDSGPQDEAGAIRTPAMRYSFRSRMRPTSVRRNGRSPTVC